MRFASDIGLALSGGGFRATLYHLGVIRYLRDSGTLEHVRDIAAVSGGSILAAHLVLNWDRYTGDDAAFAEAAQEVIRFVQSDIRNHVARRMPLFFPLRLAGRLAGSDTPGLAATSMLERAYRDFLYGDRRLFELPERPGLHMVTTNVADGTLAVCNRQGLHILRRERGRVEAGEAAGGRADDTDGGESRDAIGLPASLESVPGAILSVAKAVAASSAFPGFFPPVQITAADLGVNPGEFPEESFTDGGVYDNLGTRAFTWIGRMHDTDYDRILASDAGKPFRILGRGTIGFLAQSIRATDILWDRVWQLERDNFSDQNGFFFAPITQVVDPRDDPHALHPVVQRQVALLRTDLDRFSDLEVAALVQHGYEVARSTHRGIADRSDLPVREGPTWDPLPGRHPLVATTAAGGAASAAPAPGQRTARVGATAPAAAAAAVLRRGSRRRIWSTLFDARDWPTWVYAVLGVLLFVALPWWTWRVHRHAALLTSVIDSIAAGDPDIRLVLDLVEGDPTATWQIVPIASATEATPTVSFAGVEILSYSRIVDLRGARGRDDDAIRFRERAIVRPGPEPPADGRLVFHSLMPADRVEFLQPPGQPPLRIRRVRLPGESGPGRLEFHWDLASVPSGHSVTLELATRLRSPLFKTGRIPLDLQVAPELLSVWMLFPQDRPYASYELVRWPDDDPAHVTPMTPRYTIDHPYGALIGWSLINPQVRTVYECRWTQAR
jgi:predicted acylesterase/phospholipase RssA